VTGPAVDPAFPRLHGRPPRGWVNDPNGCSYVDGRWHVFFQHNPDSPTHGTIKWGHMSSADLVRWEPEPVALTNRPGELDSFGCWSGCVVDDDGVPTAVYSAVADAGHRSEVLLARSDRRMVSWAQERKSVAGQPDDPAISHVRDPYVFTVDGRRYAVQGAGHVEGRGRILVHGCDDLTAWTFLGDLLTSDDPVAGRLAPANIWECPSLVRFGDRWVLIVSLWRRRAGLPGPAGVRYLVGDLAVGPRGPRFTPTGGGLLDDGPCFYAPQALALPDRTLLWAWSWELGRSAQDVERAGWAGTLTFCRELTLTGDVLACRPAPELDGLRTTPLAVTAGEPFAASAYDCLLPPGGGRVTLALVDDGVELVVVDRPLVADPLTPPRLLVDGSVIELFDGGPTAHTTRAYPSAASRWVLRLERPGPLHAWRLGLG
jgi:beta-fructofuranosidase